MATVRSTDIDSLSGSRVSDQTLTQSVPSSGRLWAGRALGLLPALLLLLDGGMKVWKPDFVVKATTELGYSESVILPLGLVLLCCTLCYLNPSTSVFGAILLTGYLGGAVASHVRMGQGAVPIAIPIVFATLLWSGLCLCRPAVGSAVFRPR